MNIGNINVDEILNRLAEFVSLYGLRILAAALIFFVGRWVSGILTRALQRMMQRQKVDPVITSFAGSLVYVVLTVFVVVATIGQLGVQTTSFVAVLGAAGLAVGLALQGSLSNFAAGVLIIFFRPFKIGDFIEAAGTSGIVRGITILTTELHSPDNKKIIIPNSAIMNGTITNVTANPTRRIDMVFGVSYSDDLQKVQRVLESLVAAEPRVLKDPAPEVVVLSLGDNSVNFAVRPWVQASDYWPVLCDFLKNVKLRFDKEGITIPFPQRDVHLFPMEPAKRATA